MNDYINDFLDYLVVEKGLSNNTQDSYRFDLLDFSKYLDEKKIIIMLYYMLLLIN